MLRAVFLLLLVNLSGCSAIFGDTFSDKAKGYHGIELSAKMQQVEGQSALPIQDILVIPELTDKQQANAVSQNENTKQEFVTPAPRQLLVVEQEQETASLSDSQSYALNPRLERDGAGTQILRLDGRYGVAWSAIAEAIAKTEYKLSDLNRSTGTYYGSILSLIHI